MASVDRHTASRPNATTYYSVTHADEFDIDWKIYYERIDRLSDEVRRKREHKLDVEYGPHPKQRLDLYFPKSEPANAPVFLFVHGGGFIEGDRWHYGFVAEPLAQHGVITAVASYRLAPYDAPDDPVDDVANAIAWLTEHAVELGANPQRIHIGGHSAGAILTSLLGVTEEWRSKRALPRDVVAGCAAISAPYELKGEEWIEPWITKSEVRDAYSPLRCIRVLPQELVVAVGSKETHWHETSSEFAHTLENKGIRAPLVIIEDADHVGAALALASVESPLTQAIWRMISRSARSAE